MRKPPTLLLSSPGTFSYRTALLVYVVVMFSLTTRPQRIEWSPTLTGGGGRVWYGMMRLHVHIHVHR